MAARTPALALQNEPTWPQVTGSGTGCRVIFLADASSGVERRLVRDWAERNRPEAVGERSYEIVFLPAKLGAGDRAPLDPKLETALAGRADPLLAPLRVAWLPALRDGSRAVHLWDLLWLSDPRDPGVLRQRWILRRHRDRCRIVAGAPAPASELRARWGAAGESGNGVTTSLPEFVADQATLALERAERALTGARYKVPRLVHQQVLKSPAFRAGVAELARELGKPEAKVKREAAANLKEIAATHSPLVIDLGARLIRRLWRRGYSELRYDREKLQGLYRLAQQHPVVFLPSHKSNLDHLVLQYALYENDFPPNHTAGGINMNFFPIGSLVHRSGVFFIRRSFKDNEVYKHVLRSYVDYLVEKRFSLEWYIEGGRSRSGKLLPPRFGLLAYVVDAFRRAKSDDVYLIPVSIAYDQIEDVGSYADEQRGGKKERESLGWFLKMIRGLQEGFGDIHIQFGEPLSLAAQLGAPTPGREPDPDEKNLDLQKIAFETSVRINRVTPITPTSLVTLALLGMGDRALTVRETRVSLKNLVSYAKKRKLPTTAELDHLEDDTGVQATLESLAQSGVVSRFDEGPETVYRIGPDEQLAAAYYANTIIHFFVNGAIIELALLYAADPSVSDPVDEFWNETMELRDLLKFEFFFADKDTFRRELREELAFQEPNWKEELSRGGEALQRLINSRRPFSAHRVLRTFLQSYAVVADNLARTDADQPIDRATFIAQCLALGKQYVLQRRIHSAASVSKVLFETALKLADNRGLLDEGEAEDLVRGRTLFAETISDLLRRVDAIDALARSRRAGLIP